MSDVIIFGKIFTKQSIGKFMHEICQQQLL